jgi:hypothetical protein
MPDRPELPKSTSASPSSPGTYSGSSPEGSDSSPLSAAWALARVVLGRRRRSGGVRVR